MIPCAMPGAPPAYRTGASFPSIVAETGNVARGNRSGVTTVPSTPTGDNGPKPVAYNTTTDPAGAGFVTAFNVPSSLTAIAGPLPDPSSEKIPGAHSATITGRGTDSWPWYST